MPDPESIPRKRIERVLNWATRYASDMGAGPSPADQADIDYVLTLALAADGYREALEGYERWEAALILDPAAWRGEFPIFTADLYAKWMELQAKRNAVLKPVAAGAIGGKPE